MRQKERPGDWVDKWIYSQDTITSYSSAVMKILNPLSNYTFVALGPETYTSVIQELMQLFDAPYHAIEQSLNPFSQTELTLSLRRGLAQRFAGNAHKLAAGVPVLPWNPRSIDEEWCLVRVVEVEDKQTMKSGKRGFRLVTSVFTGGPAGQELKQLIRAGREQTIFHDIGWGWKASEMMYPADLVGMICYAFLKRGWKEEDPPYFYRFHATAKQKKFNKELFENRQNYKACRYNWKPKPFKNCLECPVGYETSTRPNGHQCPFAMRRQTIYDDDQHTSDAPTGGDAVVCSGT